MATDAVAESSATRFDAAAMAYVIITAEGTPLADRDGLGVIVFETEASAARFMTERERVEWWSDARLTRWNNRERQTSPD